MSEVTPKPINDADRLKWLEETQSLLNFSDNGPHVCVGSDGGNDHYYGKTYREAVDNAMEGCLLKKAEAGFKAP